MKISYDYTKDKKYKSYEKTIYNSLIKLGFRITNVGTTYLKDLILFAHFQNCYEINITKLAKEFMQYKNIDYISYKTFINSIDYAVKNVDNKKFKNNFEKVFDVEFDEYYNSAKILIMIFFNMFI